MFCTIYRAELFGVQVTKVCGFIMNWQYLKSAIERGNLIGNLNSAGEYLSVFVSINFNPEVCWQKGTVVECMSTRQEPIVPVVRKLIPMEIKDHGINNYFP
jgi:hypothetical protein